MMKISILGTGCTKCKKLTENAERAARELNIVYSIEKITDINEIMKYGVMMTPAFVINDKIKFVSKVASVDELKIILNKESLGI